MQREKKNKKIIVIDILISLVVVALLFTGYKVYRTFKDDKEAIQEYEKLQNIAIDDGETDKNGEGSIVVDFEKLSKINPQIVAWIYFEEPSVINYPIVQGEDNEKYLKTSFEGEENGAGCIYMDAQNKKDFGDKNTFIYGHNRRNGHMFGSLMNYKDEEYYKSHPYFEIHTPDGYKTQYQIFAVAEVDSTSESYKRVYVNETEYSNYIDMIRKTSLYQTDVEVTKDSYIVSLSTCTNARMEERFIIHAVKIKQEQSKEE